MVFFYALSASSGGKKRRDTLLSDYSCSIVVCITEYEFGQQRSLQMSVPVSPMLPPWRNDLHDTLCAKPSFPATIGNYITALEGFST